MSGEPNSTRLTSFNVDRLFHEFSPRIPLNLNEHITAVIGPNGRGKTVCLRLINALFRRQWYYFSSVAFSRVEYSFSTRETVEVFKSGQTDKRPLSPSREGVAMPADL